MALPTDFFAGYTSDGTSITIPLAALEGLTAAEADAATGDGRKVAFELVKQIRDGFAALDPAPGRMNVTVGTPTGVSASVVRRSFNLTFDVDIAEADVAAEV
jgi:hypothetical protein